MKLFPWIVFSYGNWSQSQIFCELSTLETFFLILTRPRAPSDLISLTILITVRLCALFSPKIREIKKNKMLKFALPGNYISELSTEIEIWY